MGDTKHAENESLSTQCKIRSSSPRLPINLLPRRTYLDLNSSAENIFDFLRNCALNRLRQAAGSRQWAVNDGISRPIHSRRGMAALENCTSET